jgi:putative transposase
MRPVLLALLAFLTTLLRSRLALQLEIVALRHQVAIYQQSVSRPRLHAADRLFWSWLSRLWPS